MASLASTVRIRAKSLTISPLLALQAVGAFLAAFAIVRIGASVATIMRLSEADWGEALIHDHAARLVRGEPLYQLPGETFFSVATYTPVYYYVVAGLQAIFGPGFGPGRAVSLIAGLATAGLIAWIVRRRLRSWWAGGFAAVLFLVFGMAIAPPVPRYAIYKEEMLGLLLSFGVLATLVAGVKPKHIALAGLLAGLAFLTKQTMLITAFAAAVWLWRRDRGGSLLFCGVAFLVGAGTCLVMEITTGAFIHNTVIALINPFLLDYLPLWILVLVRLLGGVTVLALLYLVARARSRPSELDDILVYFWAASALLVLVTLPKMGTNVNHLMPFGAATVVLATFAIWDRLDQFRAPNFGRLAYLPALLLAGTLAMNTRFVTTAWLFAVSVFAPDTQYAGDFSRLIDRVRNEPAQVLADPGDVVTLAGRPMLTEPWAMSLAYHYRIWPWDERPLVELICSGGVGLLILDYRLEVAEHDFGGIPHWPPPATAALREAMVFDEERGGRYIYVHRAPQPGGVCETRPL